MRVFIAIPLPSELRENFSGVEKKIAVLGKLKLVERENLHLTLKFLGEVSDEGLGKILKSLKLMPKSGNFSVSLKGLGTFPSENYVRVIWAGVEKGRDEIIKLQKLIDKNISTLKFKKEGRFHPHFTLARVKWIDKGKLKNLLKEYENFDFGEFSVESIDLMKSELRRDGAVYSLLERIHI